MQTDGLLLASSEKPGSRPEKTVYTITDKGKKAFREMLNGLLEFDYNPVFSSDGLFYFSDYIETTDITVNLKVYIEKLNQTITGIQDHKKQIMQFIPDDLKTTVNIIFSHHEYHYQAELRWAADALKNLLWKP